MSQGYSVVSFVRYMRIGLFESNSFVGTGSDVPRKVSEAVLTLHVKSASFHWICSRWWVLVFTYSHLLLKLRRW